MRPLLPVSDIAWDQLSGVVWKRKGEVALTDTDLQEFLNSTPAQGEYRQGDVRSLWSTVRKSIKRLGCQVTVEGMEVKLVRGEKTVCAQRKKAVRQFLNDTRDAARLEHLLQATDLGRSFHLVSQHPSSSHWIKEGSFVSFADYRFAIKGRLNLLPTKVVIKRTGKPHLDSTCPKCKQEAQTLGHVLNTCTPNTGLMNLTEMNSTDSITRSLSTHSTSNLFAVYIA